MEVFYSRGITLVLAVTAMMLIIATPRIITAIVPNSGTTWIFEADTTIFF